MSDELKLILGVSSFFVLFLGYINSIMKRGAKTKTKKTKKRVNPTKKSDTQCYNGICRTLNVLEAELDEFADKYPDSKLNSKLRRKIKALM